jgi:hypothetical protein
MADTHEEQLLSDLLGRIAREDARLDARHLESRVMDGVDSRTTVRLKPDTTYWAVAAAALFAVLLPATLWLNSVPRVDTVGPKTDTTEVTIPDKSEVPVKVQALRSDPPRPAVAPRATAGKRTVPTNLTNPTNPSYTPEEFVPLMPLSERELAGPFQIVRVQMPRASLGNLLSPLEHPNEVIEADVLLGEDGMARAIRVSASGSVYPWRSR